MQGDSIDSEWDATHSVGRELEPESATLRSIRAMGRFLRELKCKRQKKRLGRGI